MKGTGSSTACGAWVRRPVQLGLQQHFCSGVFLGCQHLCDDLLLKHTIFKQAVDYLSMSVKEILFSFRPLGFNTTPSLPSVTTCTRALVVHDFLVGVLLHALHSFTVV
jgi:hypothetical protein